jgi:hypothetical protein
VEGFLLAPGTIDLSELRFFTVGDGTRSSYDDDDTLVDVDEDDDVYETITEDDETEDDDEADEEAFDDDLVNDDFTGEDGGDRLLEEGDDRNDYMMEGSAVDIAVFHLVSKQAVTGMESVSLPTTV